MSGDLRERAQALRDAFLKAAGRGNEREGKERVAAPERTAGEREHVPGGRSHAPRAERTLEMPGRIGDAVRAETFRDRQAAEDQRARQPKTESQALRDTFDRAAGRSDASGERTKDQRER